MNPELPTKNVRRLGVRSRTTFVAVGVVALCLALGAVLFVGQVRARLEGIVTEAAIDRAATLAASVHTADAGLPVGDPELVAQLVDASGNVVASDQAARGMPAFFEADLTPAESAEYRLDHVEPGPGAVSAFDPDEGPFVVAAHGVSLAGGNGVVLVAASLDNAAEAVRQSIPPLAIGLPVLLAIVAFLTWILTGRALAPVEQMRINAGEISASELHRRLHVPPTRDELERLATTLNQMLSRLEDSALRQRRFVADASHELKSPLAALRTMIDVGEEHPDLPGEARLAADLRPEIERMQSLVDDLLVLARDEENPWSKKKVEVKLDRIVMSEAERLARRDSIAVDTEGVGPAVVEGDPVRLAQLVRNLTDNAARHATGKVWLNLSVNDGMVDLGVSDDGLGIPESERERVFDRFVRLDDSRSRDAGGSGLGLAVARSIVRSHGGELAVMNPEHGGATLRARFPKA